MKYALVVVQATGIGRPGARSFVNEFVGRLPITKNSFFVGEASWLFALQSDSDFFAAVINRAEFFELPYAIHYFQDDPVVFESHPS